MSNCVTEVLNSCHCSATDLAAQTCETLEKVQQAAGAKILELLECIGGPRQVGDERYDHHGDIESLLRIMKCAEEFCRIKRPKAHYASARSIGGCPSNKCGPSRKSLEERYLACCNQHPRYLYGG